MVLSTELTQRCEGKCELCSQSSDLISLTLAPKTGASDDDNIALCSNCHEQYIGEKESDSNHWRCLSDSMWSQVPAVQVASYRMLQRLSSEGWAQDALGMMYMDDATIEWAEDGPDASIVHKDCNGNVLSNGDSVTLIQDLNVKGASLVAKRGTAVRRIRLVPDNAEHIEGKVDGQHIVILTKYVKKS